VVFTKPDARPSLTEEWKLVQFSSGFDDSAARRAIGSLCGLPKYGSMASQDPKTFFIAVLSSSSLRCGNDEWIIRDGLMLAPPELRSQHEACSEFRDGIVELPRTDKLDECISARLSS
jgi:hypothetical protein